MTGYTFNQLFDFTRTTAATFVGSNGLIQTTPASVNLLTFTQEFDNAVWSKIGLGTGSPPTVTANAAIAPDGTSTADLVAFNRGAGNAIGDRSTINSLPTVVNGLTYVASIYIKAATAGDIGKQVAFRGVAGVGYQVITLTADWVRISSAELSSSTTGNFELASRGTISADNQVSALIWGAQLELGSTATTYARNNGGLFPPRFDYDPVTLAPRGILIEEQRTNLLLYSEQFDNAAWGKVRSSVTANSTLSPDGTTNADKLVEDTTASNTHSLQQTFSATTGTSYTFSVYLKAAERGWAALQFNSAIFADASSRTAYFNLLTGAVGNTVGSPITNVVNAGGGWWRVSITVSATLTATGTTFIYLSDGNGGALYTGNGTSGIFIYGAQNEAGAFATSYIPTAASQVTRTADVCTITAPMFAPWFNQSEGTVVISADTASWASIPIIAGYNTGSTASFVYFQVNTANTWNGTTVLSTAAGTVANNVPANAAMAYTASTRAITLNGGAVASDGNSIGTASVLALGAAGNPGYSSQRLNGHIRRITYYPFRASNNQLQALST